VAALRFAIWGIFSGKGSHRTILSQRRTMGERGFVSGSGGRSLPEAEAFSLNYTLILDFLSMIYNINLRCYVVQWTSANICFIMNFIGGLDQEGQKPPLEPPLRIIIVHRRLCIAYWWRDYWLMLYIIRGLHDTGPQISRIHPGIVSGGTLLTTRRHNQVKRFVWGCSILDAGLVSLILSNFHGHYSIPVMWAIRRYA